MITKNNIYNLIKDIKTLINSDEFKNKHCEKATFTRNRKLSFRDVQKFYRTSPRFRNRRVGGGLIIIIYGL